MSEQRACRSRQVRDQKGDYLLAVKGNQPALHAAVEGVFAAACEAGFEGVSHTGHATDESGHGRAEERYVTVIADPVGLPAEWPDVAAVVQVNRERTVGGRTATSTHYYVTSRRGTAADRSNSLARFRPTARLPAASCGIRAGRQILQ